MNFMVTIFFVFTLLILRINGVEESNRKLSRENVAEIEKQIQLQNKHTVQTIRTPHGDIYDCVDFYKQPAFDHPLLKYHNLNPQKNPTLSPEKAINKSFTVITPRLGLTEGGCPNGTVPIRRVTKEVEILDGGTRYARCSTRGLDTGYSGVSATIAAYNPRIVFNNKYSAAVMKLHIGPDSIEAGWRVDPQLYQDFKTHIYIRTNTRNARCFDARCPGFVTSGSNIPLGYALDKVSIPGGERYGFDMSITNDGTGTWILRLTGGTEIGYWPVSLFEQPGQADNVEWGGEVFAPSGWSRPGMGSGMEVTEDTSKDAYFSNVKVINGPISGGKSIDPVNLICEAQTGFYTAKNEGNVGDGLQYLIFYGGHESTTR